MKINPRATGYFCSCNTGLPGLNFSRPLASRQPHLMRLFTHNFLQCHVKNCNSNSFPLKFVDADVQEKTAEFNADFLALQMCKIDYSALLATLQELNISTEGLPLEMPDAPYSTEFLHALHHAMLEHIVNDGKMVCQGCGHVYPIVNGIPNMLLHEDEI